MKITCLSWSLIFTAVSLSAPLVHASPFSDAVLSASPSAFYRMNEDPAGVLTQLTDSSPNGNHGTWGTTLTQGQIDGGMPPTITLDHMVPLAGFAGPTPSLGFTGIESSNVAARFSGNQLTDPDGEGPMEANPVPDLMEVPDDGTFSNPMATVSFLMSSTEEVGNDGRMFNTKNFDPNPFLVVNGGNACHGCIIVSTQDFAPVGVPFDSMPNKADGNWHHVVVVRNGSSAAAAEVYFDGIKFSGNDLVPVFDSFSTTDGAAMIGSRTRGTNPGWGSHTGGLDEFAYWNRALDQSEVTSIYNSLFASAGQDGDFDGDGDVDGNDFLDWQRGAATPADLVLWQDNYGFTPPPVMAVSAVPEPSAVLLLGIGLVVASTRSRRFV